MSRVRRSFYRDAAAGLLAGCVFFMTQQPVPSAAPHGPGGAEDAVKCMQAGMEGRPECRKPMPPCPLRTKLAGAPGPLVMLPNGVCGMLLDGGPTEKKETKK